MLPVAQPATSSPTSDFGPSTPAGVLTLAAGETLFQEGDPRLHVYRVETGSICLFKQRADGTLDVIEFAFPGDLVGLGYLDKHVTGAQATLATTLSRLPRSDIQPATSQPASARARLTAAIEREVAFLNEAPQASKLSPLPLERIAALFVTLSRCNAYEGRDPLLITDSMNCGVVAGYLDLSLADLARHLKELEALGLVAAAGPNLRLADLEALERLADGAG